MDTISELLAAYRTGALTPRTHLSGIRRAIAGSDPHNAWITVIDEPLLESHIARLEQADPAALPLYGVPFAVKDNIDVAELATTAACPDYRYQPDGSATVVRHLIEAGAVPMGKTNLDQFATGLVGARSPYGPCRNAFDPERVAGGSSAGSAVAVALGQVSFSLGTDTAGSGRVPAAFNNLVGLKPSRGLLSTRGVVPACRSLDCVSIFGLCADDVQRVFAVTQAFDPLDAQSRPLQSPLPLRADIPANGFRFGVPAETDLAFFGNEAGNAAFKAAVSALESLGGIAEPIDLKPFLEAARLLYDGPWVAERYAAIRDFIESRPEALLSVTHQIIGSGSKPLACDLFAAEHLLAERRRQTEAVWTSVDCIVTPTAPTLPTLAAVEADPIGINSQLGYYTNFMNLLDLSAVAAPAGFTPDGLPFGITLFAPAFLDRPLLDLADRLQRQQALPLGTSERTVPSSEQPWPDHGEHRLRIAVCGAHMSGLPLNHELTERGGRFLRASQTAPEYRLYALPGGPPTRPGLVRVNDGGSAIALEVWTLPRRAVGDFLTGIPAPLGLGQVRLADGDQVPGFLCEAAAATPDAEDISALGSWRRYAGSS
ncbi:allophanate hydrolase [uncultured Thiohalocapsa sp.]|uniref:allophanate hydrolase n=1 Tax=uncultured Thiohalocapsa sp. TaxID=768990 RepID=UPI0025FFA92C|nr:allophanate hydrolase [uncultured Thiohalocapsa sp.]